MAIVWDTYDITPQEFANRSALDQISGRLEALEAKHAAAVAAVEAFGDQDKINAGHDQAKIQALADAVNLERSIADLIKSASVGKTAAEVFAAGGDWAAFRSYLGPIVNALYDAGVVDSDEVRAALNAA